MPVLYEFREAQPSVRNVRTTVPSFHACAAQLSMHTTVVGRFVDNKTAQYKKLIHGLIDYDKLNRTGKMDAAAQRSFHMALDFADAPIDIYKSDKRYCWQFTKLFVTLLAYYDNCKFYDQTLNLLMGLSAGIYWAIFFNLSDEVVDSEAKPDTKGAFDSDYLNLTTKWYVCVCADG